MSQTSEKQEFSSITSRFRSKSRQYSQGVSVAVGGGNVVELRSEGQGQGFTYRGKLHLGSSLDDVLDVLGQPRAET